MVKRSDYKSLSRYVSSYLGSLKTHSLDINGQEWKYLDGGEGETIVFLHGLAGSKVLWRSLMQSYVGRYRVISVDVPGLCVEQPFNNNKKHNFREISNWLELFLEHLQIENVHLFGHSTGCTVASHFASTRPSLVASATLLNHLDVISKNTAYQGNYIFDTFVNLAEADSLDAWTDLINSLFYAPPALPGFIQRYRQRSFLSHRERMLSLVDELSEYMPMAMSYLRKMECPILVVNSTHDIFSPAEFHQTLKSQLPWGRHVLLEQSGHASFIEKPDVILGIHQDFLSSLMQPDLAAG